MVKKKQQSGRKKEIVNLVPSFTPKVSVVIPFKNDEGYIHQAVDSVAYQTFSEIQIICLDQGSTDNSKNIVVGFFGEDTRVQIISASAKKNLSSYITGDYVLILNPNDYLEPTALEKLYKKATLTDAEIVFSGFVNYDNQEMKDIEATEAFQKEKIPPTHIFSAYDCEGFLFDLVPTVHGCYLYKRDSFSRAFLVFSADLLSLSPIFKSLVLSSKIAYIDFNLLHHRIGENLDKLDLITDFKEIQTFLRESYNDSHRASFIRCFLKIFWHRHNGLKEPERSRFDFQIIKEVFPSLSDCLELLSQYPISSLLSKSNLSYAFEKMLFSNSEKIIPIVIPARWDIDAYNAAVTIQSIIDKASDGHFYDVYVLHMNDLNLHTIGQLESLSQGVVRVTCLNIEKYLPKGFSSKIKDVFDCHLFLLSDIFSRYSKMLYLLPQMIVQKDLMEFFEVDMSDKVIAGTMSYEDINYVERDLGLIYESFISNQVLLIDLNMWRQENLVQRCLDLVLVPLRKYRALIRDILNYTCADKIHVLPDCYNGRLSFILGKERVENYPNSLDYFTIINYNSEKPWAYPELELMDIWWLVARKSPFYETILFRNISDRIQAHQKLEGATVTSSKSTLSSSKPVIKMAPKPALKPITVQQVLNRAYAANDDSLYPLIKRYVKEALCVCFTFGRTRKRHKELLEKIIQEINEKVNCS